MTEEQAMLSTSVAKINIFSSASILLFISIDIALQSAGKLFSNSFIDYKLFKTDVYSSSR